MELITTIVIIILAILVILQFIIIIYLLKKSKNLPAAQEVKHEDFETRIKELKNNLK